MNTRAKWMMAGAVLLGWAGGCAERTPVLHIYTWSDYVKPELVQRFERENGCRVVIDTYDSNEAMYAKLKAGAAGYDLLFPSSYYTEVHRIGETIKVDAGNIVQVRGKQHILLP